MAQFVTHIQPTLLEAAQGHLPHHHGHQVGMQHSSHLPHSGHNMPSPPTMHHGHGHGHGHHHSPSHANLSHSASREISNGKSSKHHSSSHHQPMSPKSATDHHHHHGGAAELQHQYHQQYHQQMAQIQHHQHTHHTSSATGCDERKPSRPQPSPYGLGKFRTSLSHFIL
nr:uncharacterized histidine-rich protein DDB_G0274557-like [Aedes albopictus]XP_029731526.1 uncharacterized histidine-rich protein DDB_G0274557-like [Aedes albopictus]